MTQLKYNIKSLLSKHPINVARVLKKEIKTVNKWSDSKFSNIINATNKDKANIKVDEALKIANILKCEIKEIILNENETA